MRCRHAVGGEPTPDLTETSAGIVFGSDPLNDVGRHGFSTAWSCLRLRLPARRLPAFVDYSLEFVDGNQPRAPRHLDRVDQREDTTVEGRSADTKRCGCLCPRVGEPLDARRFSNDSGRRASPISSRGMSLGLLASASQTAARHPYSVHK